MHIIYLKLYLSLNNMSADVTQNLQKYIIYKVPCDLPNYCLIKDMPIYLI